MFSTEQLVQRWEDQREIKNLMGKYANCLILNREQDIFDMFWAGREDICLGFNDGWYAGRDAVRDYYGACVRRSALVAKILKEHFPEQLGGLSDEEMYGRGPFKIKPISSPVIEVATDGKTAKGLWHCNGSYNDVEGCGPVAHWTWGYYAVDFVREDEGWKIWHMSYTNDIDCIGGQSWGKPARALPEIDVFAPLKEFRYPEYTVRMTVRVLYSPERPHTDAPAIPEAYDTFANTFSYGI